MAKFETRVAGVSFYNVNFSAITSRSKVNLTPDPKNPHDRNAIKVLIDGRHVGHIPKTLNVTLIEYLDRQCGVTARVSRVTDSGTKHFRGIALDISVDSPGAQRPTQSSSLGPVVVTRQEGIRVICSTAPLPDICQHKVGWVEFLENKKGLAPKKDLPKEPDYNALRHQEVPFLKRLFKDPAPFIQAKRKEWQQACHLVETHNEQRLEQLKAFLDQKLDREFWEYEKEVQISRLFQALGITLLSGAEIEAKRRRGYMTVYEEFIFQSLNRHYTLFRQAKIDGHNLDFLVVLSKPYRLWAIEVDGGIHRRQSVVARDARRETNLARLGIHLIRVSNRCITKDHRQAVDRVLEVLRQG